MSQESPKLDNDVLLQVIDALVGFNPSQYKKWEERYQDDALDKYIKLLERIAVHILDYLDGKGNLYDYNNEKSEIVRAIGANIIDFADEIKAGREA